MCIPIASTAFNNVTPSAMPVDKSDMVLADWPLATKCWFSHAAASCYMGWGGGGVGGDSNESHTNVNAYI